MIFEAKLTQRINRAPNIESFRFQLIDPVAAPVAAAAYSASSQAAGGFSRQTIVTAVGSRLNFFAGQFVQVIFDRENISNLPLNKYLSFSSSPARDFFEVTKKLSASQFSGKLRALQPGDTVLFNGPLGTCIFKDTMPKIVFVVGGIGITPVVSIIEYIIDKKFSTDVVLVYSNRSQEDIAFRSELDSWQKISNKIKVYYTVTDCKPQDTRCQWTVITKEVLQKATKDWDSRMCFVYGPPKMVGAMKKLCLEAGCQDRNLKAENFIGY